MLSTSRKPGTAVGPLPPPLEASPTQPHVGQSRPARAAVSRNAGHGTWREHRPEPGRRLAALGPSATRARRNSKAWCGAVASARAWTARLVPGAAATPTRRLGGWCLGLPVVWASTRRGSPSGLRAWVRAWVHPPTQMPGETGETGGGQRVVCWLSSKPLPVVGVPTDRTRRAGGRISDTSADGFFGRARRGPRRRLRRLAELNNSASVARP